MKLHLLIIVAFFIPNLLFSQSLDELDKKKGFKEFKLGDPYEKWKSTVQSMGNSGGVSMYTYTGTCCQDVFGNKVQKIILFFYQNKLSIINIKLTNLTSDVVEEKYDDIRDNFRLIFGNNTGMVGPMGNPNTSYVWVGNSVVLELKPNYVNYEEDYEPNIYVIDKMDAINRKKAGF